jgi:hypothetical protein
MSSALTFEDFPLETDTLLAAAASYIGAVWAWIV